MLKNTILFLGLLLHASLSVAQQMSQENMIAISAVVSDELAVNSGIRKALETKTRQMLTQNGLASQSERFVLTPNITELTKDVTATAPPMFSIDFEVAFYIIDVVEQTIIDEISFPVQGVNQQEHKAYIQGINQVNVRSAEVKKFIDNSKQKIVAYYKTRIPAIIKQAETLASQALYDDALSLLSGVPDCIEGYDAVANEMTKTYKKLLNHDADILINKANGLIATRDYEAAIELLAEVDPLSDRYKTAKSHVEKIRTQINASELASVQAKMMAFEMRKEEELRKHNDEVTIKKMSIAAARDIAIANEKKENSLMVSINRWFKAKFN